MSIFKKATRQRTRFNTQRGQLTVEDLWQLSLEELNSIAMRVNKDLKDESEESFISEVTPASTELKLKLEILKSIIDTRLAEREASQNRIKTEQRKARIREMLAKKDDEALGELSREELEAELNA